MSAASVSPSTLLLCIDMQPAFLAAVPDGARVQRRCAFALSAARGLGLPVVFTEQVPKKLGPTAPELLALVDGAQTFGKDAFSALADDAVLARVRELGAAHLLLCGIETPVCVHQTALDALRLGFAVTLLADALGARRADDAEVALAALRQAGARVLPSESVFYALLHDARHPFFRAYTQLVKSHA